MSSAHVHDIEALRQFRVALVKFIEAAQVCLADAESDVARTLHWLDLEMAPHWATQVRKRQELVSRCRDALRQKTVYKDPTGARQSVVDEQKALKKAEAMLAEAEQKLAATKRYVRLIQHAQQEFKGGVSKLAFSLTGDLANAVLRMGNLIAILEQYAATDVPREAGSMAQPTNAVEGEAPPEPAGTEGAPEARQEPRPPEQPE